MEKVFSYGNARDKDLSLFKPVSGADPAALLRAICTNTATGYVREAQKGAGVLVPRHAAHAVARHLINNQWSLGI